MSARLLSIVTRIAVSGIILGIVGMIQPFVFELFKYGFLVLLISTIIYIIVAHINPPNVPEGEPELPVKVSDLEKQQVEPTK